MMRRAAIVLALVIVSPVALAAPAQAQETAEQAAAQTAEQAADTARMNASAKVLHRALDAWRARNFEGWLANYSDDIVIKGTGFTILGRKEMRLLYEPIFQARIPAPKILESGWTGERVYIRQLEYLDKSTPDGVSYSEYEVRGGKIVAVYGWAE